MNLPNTKLPRLLITGVSGLLGSNVSRQAIDKYTIFGTCNTHGCQLPCTTVVGVDLCNKNAVEKAFGFFGPDAVVHAAASADPDVCQKDPAHSHRINVEVTRHLAGLCAQRNIPFVFISTDLVFDGTKPPYKETDPVGPISIYGEHKVEAEAACLEAWPQATVCRIPLLFGHPGATRKSLIGPLVEAFKDRREVKLLCDEIRTPLSGSSAGRGILSMLKQNVTGRIHLGGSERISRYDLGRLVAEIYNIKDPIITPICQQEIQRVAPRPADASLDSSKAFALGHAPLPLREELTRLFLHS